MKSMREIIASLGEIPGASVEFDDRSDPGIVIAECRLPRLAAIVVCFSGDEDWSLEWYLIIKDAQTGTELWSDWMDYLGYGETDEAKLKAEQICDLQAVVDDIREAEDFRVISTGTARFLWWSWETREAQWHIHGQWQEVRIYCDR